MLHDKEIQTLRDGTFELIALNCIAHQRAAGAGVLEGSAFIRQDRQKRHLTLTLLLPGVIRPLTLPATMTGEVIPDEEYFVVRFDDVEGRSWVTEYMLGNFSYDAQSKGCTLSGRLHELRSTERGVGARTHPELRLEVFGGLRVPANAISTTERHAGGFSLRSMRLNRVEIETAFGTLEATLGEEGASIRFRGSTALKINAETRLLEALQFVASQHVEPAVSVLLEGDNAITRIVSRGLATDAQRGMPPLQDNLSQSREMVWAMFVKYFEHVSDDPSTEFHPLSAVWHRVIGGEAASLETQALIYTVAVEELVKLVRVPPKDADAVSRAQAALQDWIARTVTFLQESGMGSELLGRVTGQLRNMLGRRAVDKLYDMAAARMVRQALIPRWKKLRDISAHGTATEIPRVEDLLGRRDAALALMHEMVFAIIGYRGYFTDYATAGWPPRLYPEVPDTPLPVADA